jgi:hypothetical protein
MKKHTLKLIKNDSYDNKWLTHERLDEIWRESLLA